MKDYIMTDEQYNIVYKACAPVPQAIFSFDKASPRMFRTQKENIEEAWQNLGEELGFEWETAEENGTGPRGFSAEEIK